MVGLTDLQIEERAKNIGASEVSAILGINQYETPLDVWDRKTNPHGQVRLDNELLFWGSYLEAPIAERFSQVTGKKLAEVESAYFRGRVCSHIDRLVVDEGVPLEVKTQSSFKSVTWDGEAPDGYLIQVQTQLWCMKVEYGYICVLIGGNHMEWFRIDADPAIQAVIEEKTTYFWDEYVVKNCPPPPITYADACKLFPVNKVDAKLATESSIEALKRYQSVNTQLKALNSEKEALRLQIVESIGDHEGLMDSNGDLLATWKLTNPKPKVDPKLMLEHLTKDEIALSTIQPKGNRVLNLKSKNLNNH